MVLHLGGHNFAGWIAGGIYIRSTSGVISREIGRCSACVFTPEKTHSLTIGVRRRFTPPQKASMMAVAIMERLYGKQKYLVEIHRD
jgi:hypothetical protein